MKTVDGPGRGFEFQNSSQVRTHGWTVIQFVNLPRKSHLKIATAMALAFVGIEH